MRVGPVGVGLDDGPEGAVDPLDRGDGAGGELARADLAAGGRARPARGRRTGRTHAVPPGDASRGARSGPARPPLGVSRQLLVRGVTCGNAAAVAQLRCRLLPILPPVSLILGRTFCCPVLQGGHRCITRTSRRRSSSSTRPSGRSTPGTRCDGRLLDFFSAAWPAYRRWYLNQGEAARPAYAECAADAPRRTCPSWPPTYDRLVEAVGGGDLEARFLSHWRPPPLFAACSLLTYNRERNVLLRNYDYPPLLCDNTVLASSWHGTRVMAMTDCLWGALDGVNEHGLSVAIAFGGRPVVGDGFRYRAGRPLPAGVRDATCDEALRCCTGSRSS